MEENEVVKDISKHFKLTCQVMLQEDIARNPRSD